jgi:hypothetical protein
LHGHTNNPSIYFVAATKKKLRAARFNGKLCVLSAMEDIMLHWTADQALSELIRRYYTGEAGLWETIRQQIDDELRRRQMLHGAYHIRLRGHDDGSYDVLIDDASAYTND